MNMSVRLGNGHFEAGIMGIGDIEWAIASGMSSSLNLWMMLLFPFCLPFGHPLADLLEPWEEVATSYLHLHVDVL